MSALPPEAAATIPAENARRARLYDTLWDLAYQLGPVTLNVVGTHGIEYEVRCAGATVRGSMDTVEAKIREWQERLGGG